MSQRRPDEVLRELLATLEGARLAYALMGGYAVVTWAVPRATFDVDVLVEADPQRLQQCFELAEQRGFQVDEAFKKGWRDHVRDMPLVKLQLFRDGRPIASDLFLSATPLLQSAFARRQVVEVPGLGRSVPVITAADLLLLKLLANRPKDRLDVQNILTVQGLPDREYLEEWAGKLGVGAALERARAEAGLH